jgi:hypothetical protein
MSRCQRKIVPGVTISWMHTGDLAIMDAEGYVNIAGRIKDMVMVMVMPSCSCSGTRTRYCGGTPAGCGTSRLTGPGSPRWRGAYRAGAGPRSSP